MQQEEEKAIELMILQMGGQYGFKAGDIPLVAKQMAKQVTVQPQEPQEIEESNYEKV